MRPGGHIGLAAGGEGGTERRHRERPRVATEAFIALFTVGSVVDTAHCCRTMGWTTTPRGWDDDPQVSTHQVFEFLLS